MSVEVKFKFRIKNEFDLTQAKEEVKSKPV